MTWVKLSDTFAEDPRLEQAGPLALALHVAALCYCARQLTDGHLTRGAVRRLLELDGQDPHDVARSLVDVDMWESTDDGYRIVEYLEDQPSREHVEVTRAERAKAGRAGGKRSGEARRSNSEANTKQVASRLLEPRPVPSRSQPPPPTPSLADASAATSPAATAAPSAPAPEQEEEEEQQQRDDSQEQRASHALPDNDQDDDLTAVVLEHLPGDLRRELTADRRTLAAACHNLAAAGWTRDELEQVASRKPWHGAGPGAVISWTRSLETSARPQPARLAYRSNANRCPSGAPYASDGTCCPAHDGNAQVAAS